MVSSFVISHEAPQYPWKVCSFGFYFILLIFLFLFFLFYYFFYSNTQLIRRKQQIHIQLLAAGSCIIEVKWIQEFDLSILRTKFWNWIGLIVIDSELIVASQKGHYVLWQCVA